MDTYCHVLLGSMKVEFFMSSFHEVLHTNCFDRGPSLLESHGWHIHKELHTCIRALPVRPLPITPHSSCTGAMRMAGIRGHRASLRSIAPGRISCAARGKGSWNRDSLRMVGRKACSEQRRSFFASCDHRARHRTKSRQSQ